LAFSHTTWSAIPVYDHVVIVVEENHSYSQIIGSASAPYINNTLAAEGASFTKFYGEEHPSEGNYLWLFAGSNFNVGFGDACPVGPFSSANMASELIAQGRTFGGYSEDLPSIGSTVCSSGQYWRKHNPWVNFNNIPSGTTLATSCNLRWSDWPAGDFCSLRTVSIVVPNQNNDMHDGTVQMGDTWLQTYIDPYYQWAKLHNSLLIMTFDEAAGGSGGMTTPPDNQIATIFAGAHVIHGTYTESAGVNHINLLRTIEDMYSLTHAGAQTSQATGAGLSNSAITNVFDSTPSPKSIVRLPASFSRSVHVGNSPTDDSFTIQNGGAGTLNYSITDDAAWLDENPVSGTASCEVDTITVSYSTASLAQGNYSATITITDADASNSPQTIAISLTVLPPAYLGDFDQDGDVDMKDFGHLQLCLSGNAIPQNDPACADADIDGDSDVDVSDFNSFLACLSGSNVTPPIGCQQ
jgi:acid phosphatase